MDTHIDGLFSGFELDQGEFSCPAHGFTVLTMLATSPAYDGATSSTAPTDNLVTPGSMSLDTPLSNPGNSQAQYQHQMQQQLRMLQAQLSKRNGGPPTGPMNQASVLQSLQMAAKNGHFDASNPAFQQIRRMMILQQQQKQGQSMNNGDVPLPTPPMNDVNQMVQNAMAQQRQQQAQAQMPTPTGMSVPAAAQPVPQAPTRPPKIWSGDIVWYANNGNPVNCENLNLPCTWLSDFDPTSQAVRRRVPAQAWRHPRSVPAGLAIRYAHYSSQDVIGTETNRNAHRPISPTRLSRFTSLHTAESDTMRYLHCNRGRL